MCAQPTWSTCCQEFNSHPVGAREFLLPLLRTGSIMSMQFYQLRQWHTATAVQILIKRVRMYLNVLESQNTPDPDVSAISSIHAHTASIVMYGVVRKFRQNRSFGAP